MPGATTFVAGQLVKSTPAGEYSKTLFVAQLKM